MWFVVTYIVIGWYSNCAMRFGHFKALKLLSARMVNAVDLRGILVILIILHAHIYIHLVIATIQVVSVLLDGVLFAEGL